MLVITRKQGESFIIEMEDGTAIVIQVVKLRKGQMQIGIDDPKKRKVLRSEMPEAKEMMSHG